MATPNMALAMKIISLVVGGRLLGWKDEDGGESDFGVLVDEPLLVEEVVLSPDEVIDESFVDD